MSVNVDICLATYNGCRYFQEFHASLERQSHADWRVIARDDGSGDATPAMLAALAASQPRFTVLDDGMGNVGVIRNFSLLLAASTADYVMLADQDDVWYPDKVARSLAAIRRIERGADGTIVPALVFTDLDVVDANLQPTGATFLHMQGLSAMSQPRFRQLLTQNVAPGCTMIVNRALLALALPIPAEVAMHDWWLIQIAAQFGKVGFIAEPTIAYRQHEGNVVGAKTSRLSAIAVDMLRGSAAYRQRLRNAQRQAASFLERYGARMEDADRDAARVFAGLSNYPPLLRQALAARYGLRKAGLLRTVGFYLLM
jgi:hypothetical protein